MGAVVKLSAFFVVVGPVWRFSIQSWHSTSDSTAKSWGLCYNAAAFVAIGPMDAYIPNVGGKHEHYEGVIQGASLQQVDINCGFDSRPFKEEQLPQAGGLGHQLSAVFACGPQGGRASLVYLCGHRFFEKSSKARNEGV